MSTNVIQVGPDGKPLSTSADGLAVKMVGNSTVVSPTVTVSTSPAYSSGDVVGGKLTLTSAARVSGGLVTLQDILLVDAANQKPQLEILIFDSDPSAATTTDNGAFAFSTDISKLRARIPVAVADYVTVNSIAVASIGVIGKAIKASGSTSLYAVMVTTSTPTFAATTNVRVDFGFYQD